MIIPEFLKKIENKEIVNSPRFKLFGNEFNIAVWPGNVNPQFTSVFLMEGRKMKNQTTSVTFLERSGAQHSGERVVEFLSHEKFKTWAENHSDVFKLKATVTLHQEKTGDDWIRYCNAFLFPSLDIDNFAQE